MHTSAALGEKPGRKKPQKVVLPVRPTVLGGKKHPPKNPTF